MKLTKNVLVLIAYFMVATPFTTIANAQPNSLPDPQTPLTLPSQPLRLLGNKGLSPDRFIKKEFYQSRMKPGAVLRTVETMTYGEYMLKYGDGASVPFDTSPDRMVSVLTVDFPNGLEAENADYSNARVISARDAETGDYFSHITVGNITRQKGPIQQP